MPGSFVACSLEISAWILSLVTNRMSTTDGHWIRQAVDSFIIVSEWPFWVTWRWHDSRWRAFYYTDDAPGYQTAFSYLAFVGKKEHGPVGQMVKTPKFSWQSLHTLPTACRGKVPSWWAPGSMQKCCSVSSDSFRQPGWPRSDLCFPDWLNPPWVESLCRPLSTTAFKTASFLFEFVTVCIL